MRVQIIGLATLGPQPAGGPARRAGAPPSSALSLPASTWTTTWWRIRAHLPWAPAAWLRSARCA